MIFKHITDLVSVFYQKGGKHCISCPGSRNAVLSIYFNQHPHVDTLSISDERSAAFFGLGLSKASGSVVALSCTSGTAALNFAPAIAEAYYQHVPLLILTADRPPEWIDQQDGQTIRQNEIYGKHVKQSYQFPANPDEKDELWHCNRIINEAMNLAMQEPKGPVHINIPFREPFYPEKQEKIKFSKPRIIEESLPDRRFSLTEWNKLGKGISRMPKVLIIAGMMAHDRDLKKELSQVPFPMIVDINSNLRIGKNCISKQDAILLRQDDQLKPDIIISFGGPVLSKPLKLFLRNHKPKEHWHIQQAGTVPDIYQSLTKIVRTTPTMFFQEIRDFDFSFQDNDYLLLWKSKDRSASSKLSKLMKSAPFTEFSAMNTILNNVYGKTALHLGNSMPVRYASILGLRKEVNVHSNRGTSGIDGTTSTAVGYAYGSDKITTLITGDVAFFYDRNAFWNKYLSPNLRIIILNNNGGGIFKLIDGPSEQPEVDDFFVTDQNSDAKYIAEEFDMDYLVAFDSDELDTQIKNFFEKSKKPRILEIKTDIKQNTAFYKTYKKLMKDE